MTSKLYDRFKVPSALVENNNFMIKIQKSSQTAIKAICELFLM
jgi:hypothetical protein